MYTPDVIKKFVTIAYLKGNILPGGGRTDNNFY